ncbi:alpha/beta fold hydrolase [Glycomyces harbinensis]|uniref:Alpha/beta hydrolase family protein n=1 Tax=Glycomyces harbinensis TaxID=58114 RepID=A0A1G6W1J0_9ACTN|nr:alpha/beta hydrolase [Glycomyces harbinensis]SDD59689.1 Alpha/beta hydrolase family protein [Glycomyces harbinensis]
MRHGEPATFVLIHGGGSSSWDWHLVAPLLRERGHEAIAVDLPIEDDANGLSEYADAVVEAAAGRPNVVVVAHSLGGLTAPIACSRTPVELMVLVTAMVPLPGESMGAWWSATGHSELGLAMDTKKQVIDLFMHDLPVELAQEALRHGRDQGGGKWDEPSPLEAWPDVPTRFLLCRDDRFFPPEFMRPVVADRLGIVPDEIDGAHSVMLSRPAELADRLHRYWTERA